MGRWRALGARTQGGPRRARCARGRASRRRGWSRSAAATARCCSSWPRVWGSATFDGFELSPPAIEIARGRGIPRAGRLEAYDGARVPAEDGAYDLAVLSHVLEHVPDPAPLLAEAARVARHVLVEVPLEDNRSAARPAKRAEAARIGHLHAFNRGDVRALVAGAGLTRRRRAQRPAPRDHHAFFAEGAVGAREGRREVGRARGRVENRARGGREVLHRALRSVDRAPGLDPSRIRDLRSCREPGARCCVSK